MTSHHKSPEDEDASKRLLDQFMQRAKPHFPAGHYNADDEGQLAFAVAADLANKVVVIRFGKAVNWIGLRKEETLALSKLLKEKADQL